MAMDWLSLYCDPIIVEWADILDEQIRAYFKIQVND